jgi:hypothetical protein
VRPRPTGRYGQDHPRAEEILRRLPERVTVDVLESLDEPDMVACGYYGSRMPTVALRTRSPSLLRQALLAHAIATTMYEQDWRDTLVAQAKHHCVAQELGMSPATLFAEVADRLPAGEVTDRMRTFGARTDVTWQRFGWALVSTPDGPDIVWADP